MNNVVNHFICMVLLHDLFLPVCLEFTLIVTFPTQSFFVAGETEILVGGNVMWRSASQRTAAFGTINLRRMRLGSYLELPVMVH